MIAAGNIERIAKAWSAAGAAEAFALCGVTSGEVSERQARKVYGTWFREAVEAGRIRPVRVGVGRTATRWYSIAEILAYKAAAITRAELSSETIKNI